MRFERETTVIANRDKEWGCAAAAAMENLEPVTSMENIPRGWSGDKKYKITAADGTKYLLRITPKETSGSLDDDSLGRREYTKQQHMFQIQQSVAVLGVPMCRPVACGRCGQGFYDIQTWVEGRDAEEVIPLLSDAEQYACGLEAGRILKVIHSVPAPEEQPDWETRFNAKMDRKIQMYHQCSLKFDGADDLIAYIEANRSLLKGRPQCFQHGDYHIGNMMIEKDKLVIIDFDRYDFGDPWEEFNRIVWCAQCSPLFASGMVNGYFDGDVPMEFWKLLALYISSNMLSSVAWAVSFGEEEIQTMRKQAQDVLNWYDHMKNPVPSWYSRGYYLQYMDGLPYKMKAPFDFGFVQEYGKVFKVYDDQDSGNICFGVCGERKSGPVLLPENKGERYFVKFAGAPTERYEGEPGEAVERLKDTLPIYRDLRHPSLIELVDVREAAGGFAMVFKWAEGDCMGRMYPAQHQRFMNMPLEDRLQVFRDVAVFLEYVNSRGYVAIDFYDGSVLYDPDGQGEPAAPDRNAESTRRGRTTICDIDFFSKKPYFNTMGRMWGSSSFMSPEEFTLGAEIDEITNVYTAGAFAFALFGGYRREAGTWTLGQASFEVARRAVSEDRGSRQQSLRQLLQEWEAALEL
ncbi:hypothetical protein IMSAGC003_02055 [Lachnospiraceae bacterium]|nr:hypothetical protein IMSAGC003_02055 [Lachnospiraceae bacterium]